MADRFPLVVVAGLLVLLTLGGYLLRSAARGEFADVLSTWRSGPEGARGMYLLAQEAGLPVARLQQDLELIPQGAQLVLLGVHHPRAWGDKDLLGAAPDAGTFPELDEVRRRRGMNALMAPRLNSDERDKLLAHVASGHTAIYVPGGDLDDPLLEALGAALVRVEGSHPRQLVPPQPSVWTLGVEHALAQAPWHLDLPPDGLPLLVDGAEELTVAALLHWGQGQVVVVAAPDLAMNRRLDQADNAQLWLSLLGAAARGGPVLFDEFHHGFSDERSMAAFAARYGLHFAILQLLLGVGLWSFALRRFGRPRLPEQAQRVASTDALFAASRIYREGRHHAYAARLLSDGVSQALAPLAALPSRADPDEVVRALRARGEDALGTSLQALLRRASNVETERDVELLARQAAALRRTLHQRTHRRTSTAVTRSPPS
jgi:hypothetical protein